jgi:hypothetical protein
MAHTVAPCTAPQGAAGAAGAAATTTAAAPPHPCPSAPLLWSRFEEHDREIAVLDFSHDDRLLATVDIDK